VFCNICCPCLRLTALSALSALSPLASLCCAAGKPVPTELKGESNSLQHDIDLDDAVTATPTSHIDDEYAEAGIHPPKLLITTSRDPSSRLTQFTKELRLIFPNSQRVNRGNSVIADLISAAKSADYTDVLIVHEHRGEPDGLIVCHLPYGPTAYFGLQSVVLRHDLSDRIGAMSEAVPHLILDNFASPLGQRLATILRYLFPIPKDDSKRVIAFVNRNDTISFRHHVVVGKGYKDVQLGEVGPRFELVLYQLKLGTVDMQEAENEWVLRPYMNTAKKRKALG